MARDVGARLVKLRKLGPQGGRATRAPLRGCESSRRLWPFGDARGGLVEIRHEEFRVPGAEHNDELLANPILPEPPSTQKTSGGAGVENPSLLVAQLGDALREPWNGRVEVAVPSVVERPPTDGGWNNDRIGYRRNRRGLRGRSGNPVPGRAGSRGGRCDVCATGWWNSAGGPSCHGPVGTHDND